MAQLQNISVANHSSMAISPSNLLKLPSFSSFNQKPTISILFAQKYLNSSFSSPNPNSQRDSWNRTISRDIASRFYGGSSNFSYDENDDTEQHSFDEAVSLFNKRDFYKCHDFLEALWNDAEEPARTLIHGILQCAVGFHHLFNQNHKGAMMELGEGLCKLRKMNFEGGPFDQFEQEISLVLEFIYQTQIELAACSEDMCLTMDQSERSYQLLGGYAAGQQVYCLDSGPNDNMYILFCPGGASNGAAEPQRVKLPILLATEEHLMACS